ncbi:MAG: YfhO family protein, partial [Chloroflexi bacterium]|nr:YfhO family protein [Chloroflexota bacterium]
LSATATAVLNLLGLSWPIALNSMYAVGLVGSGITTWWFAREFWGDRGGLVAAVAMMYTPFHLYVVFYRASLSETVAWIFPPLILWGVYRWQMMRQRRGLVTAVLSFAILFFTHDVTAYAFLPFFVVWAISLGLTKQSWRITLRGLGALALGIGAGAFFWLPALLERSSIQFGRAGSAWPFLYINNFLPLDQLLALPRNVDPLLLNDWPPRGLGAIVVLVAVVGIWRGWRIGGMMRWITAVFTFILLAYLIITQPISQILWDRIDILAAFQFPWRFLAPATLTAAFLAGAITTTATQNEPPVGLRFMIYDLRFTIAALIGLSVMHWGWVLPNLCEVPSNLNVSGMVSWERATRTLGTTASRELLPTMVQILPQEPDLPSPWVARLRPQEFPEGTRLLTAVTDTPLSTTVEIDAPTSFTARYRAFYFPGWQVKINDELVDIATTVPDGLITFDVPNGRSTIHITFTETPLRRLANSITLLTLLILTATSIFTKHSKITPLHPSNRRLHTPSPKRPQVAHPFTFLTLAIILILFKLTLVDAQQTPLHQTRLQQDGTLDNVAQPITLTFGDAANPAQIRLLGMDAIDTAVPADQPLIITLYWQPLTSITKDYRVGLTLLDEQGVRWSSIDLRDYRWLRNPPPTQGWPLDQYVKTSFFVDMLSGTPPGAYQLQLSLFEKDTLVPLTAFDASGQTLGPTFDVTAVTLTQLQDELTPDAIDMQYRLDSSGTDLRLAGSNVGLRDAAPGDQFLMTLFYGADRPGVEAVLALENEGGTAVAQWPITFPESGESVWRFQQILRLPATLTDGEYTWQLTSESGSDARWGNLTIDAPERIFDPPDVAMILETSLGNQLILYGATVESDGFVVGDDIGVSVVWQSKKELHENYRVFVHLLDETGSIVAQSDAIPANWTRPTTGWQPDEFIIDTHLLETPTTLPAGKYTIQAGMYLPTGTRLTTPDGSDAIPLQTFMLEK